MSNRKKLKKTGNNKLCDCEMMMGMKTIIQNNADILLTREIGRKAYSVLVKKHVIVHLIDSGGTVKSAVSRFIKGG